MFHDRMRSARDAKKDCQLLGRALAALTCTLLASCTYPRLFKSYTVSSREQAAAITVSATTIPWQRISTSVEPNFTITGDSALLQVAPVTAHIQDQILSAFAANASLGLARGSVISQTTANSTLNSSNNSLHTGQSNTATTGGGQPAGSTTTTTSAGANGGTVSVTTTTNSTSQPITASIPTPPTGIPAGASALTNAAMTGSPSIDPMLKYQAALALYQEVQLMNKEVQNIASRRCFVAYMVQLKIGVLPYRRYLPYDVHARVSFFPVWRVSVEANGTGKTRPAVQKIRSKNSTAGITGFSIFRRNQVTPSTPTKEEKNAPACTGERSSAPLPEVVPVLVTDDIERAVESRSVEVANQIALALSYLSPTLGGRGHLDKLQQSIQAAFGQDINSALTVTRQTDNTLYVRIGAVENATSGLSLTGRTYDVAVLLLVPKVYFSRQANEGSTAHVEIVTYSEFRNATSGAVLPERSGSLPDVADEEITQAMGDVSSTWLQHWQEFQRCAVPEGPEPNGCSMSGNGDVRPYGVEQELIAAVRQSNFSWFRDLVEMIESTNAVGTVPKSAGEINGITYSQREEELWTRLTVLLADSAYSDAEVELRGPQPVELPQSSAPVALIDDGHESSLVLGGVSGIPDNSLIAALELRTPSVATFFDTSIAYNEGSGDLTIKFPSLKQMGLKASGISGRVVLASKSCDRSVTLCAVFPGRSSTKQAGRASAKTPAVPAAPEPPSAKPPASSPESSAQRCGKRQMCYEVAYFVAGAPPAKAPNFKLSTSATVVDTSSGNRGSIVVTIAKLKKASQRVLV